MDAIDSRYKLGTIEHGPRTICYFGRNVVRHEDMSIQFDGDDNLSAISSVPTSRHRRREIDTPITHVESHSIDSVNAYVRWHGITVSPLCAQFPSRLEHLAPATTVKDYFVQATGIKKLQQLETLSSYAAMHMGSSHKIAFLVFSDAVHSAEMEQLNYLAELLLDHFGKQAIFYTLSWSALTRATALSVQFGWLKLLQQARKSTKERCDRTQCLESTTYACPSSFLSTPVISLPQSPPNETALTRAYGLIST